MRQRHLKSREKLMAGFESQITAFFEKHKPEDSILVLDSTGPSATRHYLFLRVLGMDRLQRMKEIHCISGGVFAYLGFHAVQNGDLRMPIEDFFPSFDRIFRNCHHPHFLSPVRALGNVTLKKRAAFDRQALENIQTSVFSKQYLDQKLANVDPRFIPYVGVRNQDAVANARVAFGPEGTLRDLLLAVIRVPAFYGPPTQNEPFYDAAFSKGYKAALRQFTATGAPTLISTPWREGYKGSALSINCFGHSHQKLSMLKDFTFLMLNVPNRSYQLDLEAAFT